MQFLIIARDGTDKDALQRRLDNRTAHLAGLEQAAARGEQLIAAALTDDSGNMNGSVVIADFPSRAELDAWLKVEPYVTGNVWQKIEVQSCKLAPTFHGMLKQK